MTPARSRGDSGFFRLRPTAIEMDQALQQALESKLLAMADDEMILGHRDSEWCGHAPILEEDIAFANIAQDEMGHARIWYTLRGDVNGDDPDQLVFFRDAYAYRNVRMVELPNGDWAFSMLRQYLFDLFELVYLEHLMNSVYRPLREAAQKVRQEELYHHRHTHTWIKRLGLGTEESKRRIQKALNELWPYVYQLFVPLPEEAELVEAGFLPELRLIQEQWENIATPFLSEAGLEVPAPPEETPEGREHHTAHLKELLDEMQMVARLDPEAEW